MQDYQMECDLSIDYSPEAIVREIPVAEAIDRD
jgi:hypothetical protein